MDTYGGLCEKDKSQKNNESMNKMSRFGNESMLRNGEVGPDGQPNDPPPDLAQTLVILASTAYLK